MDGANNDRPCRQAVENHTFEGRNLCGEDIEIGIDIKDLDGVPGSQQLIPSLFDAIETALGKIQLTQNGDCA